jgi:glutathione S-transferase
MAEQPTLKLMYFNFPGKAGAIRMALNYCGLAFEDYRFKDDRSDFAEMKTDGTSPFGQAPMLQVDGAKPALAQSVAVLRYVAKLAPASGLYPEDPLLAHAVDALCERGAHMTSRHHHIPTSGANTHTTIQIVCC